MLYLGCSSPRSSSEYKHLIIQIHLIPYESIPCQIKINFAPFSTVVWTIDNLLRWRKYSTPTASCVNLTKDSLNILIRFFFLHCKLNIDKTQFIPKNIEAETWANTIHPNKLYIKNDYAFKELGISETNKKIIFLKINSSYSRRERLILTIFNIDVPILGTPVNYKEKSTEHAGFQGYKIWRLLFVSCTICAPNILLRGTKYRTQKVLHNHSARKSSGNQMQF